MINWFVSLLAPFRVFVAARVWRLNGVSIPFPSSPEIIPLRALRGVGVPLLSQDFFVPFMSN